MKYDNLTSEDRKHAREAKTQDLVLELKALEQQHYSLELEYRIAAALDPPDQARMDTARAAQATLDAQYAVVQADYKAAKKG